MGKDGRNAKRITTTFTKEQGEALERIAKTNKVDVAWLIRRAVDRLVEDAEGGPLLPFDTK
jgi:hypothetical protein